MENELINISDKIIKRTNFLSEEFPFKLYHIINIIQSKCCFVYGYDEELKQWNDTEKIIIFCIDLTTKKERQYMEITDEDLRRPKGEYDYNHWFVHANWKKKYPTILELADYEFKEWMEKCGAV
jgi:hypothetical protein